MQQSKLNKNNPPLIVRILAFEEEMINRYLLDKVLTMNSYTVDTVSSAKEVTDRLANSAAYDLLIINIRAPIKDDWELVTSIRSHPDKAVSSIPIVATTTVIHPDIIKKCRDEGIVDVLMKPFDIGELSQAIKQNIRPPLHKNVK